MPERLEEEAKWKGIIRGLPLISFVTGKVPNRIIGVGFTGIVILIGMLIYYGIKKRREKR